MRDMNTGRGKRRPYLDGRNFRFDKLALEAERQRLQALLLQAGIVLTEEP